MLFDVNVLNVFFIYFRIFYNGKAIYYQHTNLYNISLAQLGTAFTIVRRLEQQQPLAALALLLSTLAFLSIMLLPSS